MSWLQRAVAGYPELLAVVAAAALGLTVASPFAWAVSHHGIDTLLVVLVAATALTVDVRTVRSLPTAWRSLAATLAVGITLLPALSWLASRLVTAGSLRDGVLVAGLAPCEIASVATTGMAGGATTVAAGVLVGSTFVTIGLAGPILGLEAGGASIHAGHIVVNLALVVALPLVVGLAVAARRPLRPRETAGAGAFATVAVAALVALVASEVRLSPRYVAVVGALVAFVAASAVVGRLLGVRSDRPVAAAVLLTTSMRDFAIAAGLAAAAFGPAAAAPLGVYGVVVLAWGTACAGGLRRRTGPVLP